MEKGHNVVLTIMGILAVIVPGLYWLFTLEHNVLALNKKIEEMNVNEKGEKQVEELRENIKTLSNRVAAIENQNNILVEQSNDLQQKLSSIDLVKFQELIKNIKTLNNSVASIENENNILVNQTKDLKQKLSFIDDILGINGQDQLVQEINLRLNKLQESENNIKKALEKLAKVDISSINDLNKRLEKLRKIEENAETMIKLAERESNKIFDQVKELKERRQKLQEMSTEKTELESNLKVKKVSFKDAILVYDYRYKHANFISSNTEIYVELLYAEIIMNNVVVHYKVSSSKKAIHFLSLSTKPDLPNVHTHLLSKNFDTLTYESSKVIVEYNEERNLILEEGSSVQSILSFKGTFDLMDIESIAFKLHFIANQKYEQNWVSPSFSFSNLKIKAID